MKSFIKPILFLLLAVSVSIVAPTLIRSNEAKAQLVYTLTPTAADDTLTNTDQATIYINTTSGSTSTLIADNISRSVTARIIKVSGTVSGTVKFLGSVDGTNWQQIDTTYDMTTADDQAVTYDMRSTSGSLTFKYYKILVDTDGTEVVIPKVYYLRRSN